MATDPRVQRTRARTLRAAFEVLGDEGVEAATIERIADCAGVHKTTIYRHWPEREQLLAEALEANMTPPPAPDTGSLRDDLVTAMRGLARTISAPPWSVLLPSLIAASSTNPRLAALQGTFTRRRREAATQAVARAKQRGELSDDVDAGHLVEALAGAIVYRHLMTHEPIDDRYVERHVDRILTAFGQDSIHRRPRP